MAIDHEAAGTGNDVFTGAFSAAAENYAVSTAVESLRLSSKLLNPGSAQ
jgi:hypothetical protein